MKAKLFLLCGMAATAITFAGCKKDIPQADIKVIAVKSVTIDNLDTTIAVGDKVALTVTVEPGDATNKHVKWSSDKPSVATIDAEGEVKALSVGTATMTATTEFGGHKASCEVTVIHGVTGISFDKQTLTLEMGGSEVLVPMIAPANATNQSVKWLSSRPYVATINPLTGQVGAVGVGEATITVITDDGGYKASCEVTVIQK